MSFSSFKALHPAATILASLIFVAAGSSAVAQTTGEWTHLASAPASKAGAERWVQPVRGELFQLDQAAIRSRLSTAARGEPSAARTSGQEIQLPMPDGTLARFVIVEAPVMADELAAKFPEIKTYAGQGIDDPSATVRMDLTPAGFHAQILSPNGAVYVDPAYRGDADLHVSYFKRDHARAFNDFQCLVDAARDAARDVTPGGQANKTQSGAILRTYRLAVAATAEYTAFHGGTVGLGQAAIVTAVNRVNGVYETELAVRLVLIGNNNLLVYTDSLTDPYTNDDGFAMLTENQNNITAVIGTANFDIGHVFSTGGGGVASLGSVCSSSVKAQGVTGSGSPTGDAFWIDYVAHEMGHQFGGNHTFNATTGSCSGNRNASTAFEPGSGLTIQAYAGICSPNDLQPNSDPYFHGGSLDEMQAFISGGGSCAVTNATGNNPPTVSVVGPTNYTIPASTPFVLTATGSDPDSDPLTYIWEEMDAGAAAALTDADNGSMALFRNFRPTNNPVRFFPKLTSILANTNWNQEKLPTTSRTMKFRVTARDNRSGGGGVSDADMTVTSVAGTGPFRVTIPNTATNWSGVRTVTWDVAGTTGAGINASGVNIYLSTNGGLAFQFLLATNVSNSGSANVLLPNLTTSLARVKVEGAGNIFFDISDANFSITPGSAVPAIQLAGTALIAESCAPTNGAIDPYETVTVKWALSNVGSAPTTNLVATLLTSNGVYYPSAAQIYGAIPAGGSVTQAFSFIPAGVCGGSVTGLVKLVDGTADMGTMSAVFSLGGTSSTVVTQVFNNLNPINIPDGLASPYPSSIAVSGVASAAAKVTVSLNGLSHTWPNDLGMLVVNPGGTGLVLMTACGGGNPLAGVNLTFDDNAATQLPATTAITSGTYRPRDNNFSYTFPSPAPGSGYGTNITALGASPNGTWSLYIVDYFVDDTGGMSGGWSLSIVSSNQAVACCTTFPAPSFTSTTYSNNLAFFKWSAIPGPNYQVQFRTNLTLGLWENLGSPIPGTNTTMGITDTVTNSPQRFYRVMVGP